MAAPVKLFKLQDGIAEALRDNTKSYDLPGICVRYGLEPGDESDAHYSKRLYVKERIRDFTFSQLVELARRVLDDFEHQGLQALLDQASAHGVAGDFRNLIFASIGPKPKIVFRDALNNVIEVVEHADSCLIYDRPLSEAGLSLKHMVDWWTEESPAQNDEFSQPESQLFSRLLASLSTDAEKILFHTYCSEILVKQGSNMPALIPQVYLHYDPYIQRKYLVSGAHLQRQRMDFLLLLPNRSRVVIEVDGKQHYSEDDKPSPRKYAEMVAEDRRLRLAGYEVYRFGGYEFVNEPQARIMLTAFFNELLSRHQVAPTDGA